MASYRESVEQAVSTNDTSTQNVTTQLASTKSKVATSVFETGPKDAVTVVDRFGKRTISTINQQVAGLKGEFDSFLSGMKIFSLTRETLREVAETTTSALRAVNDAKAQISSYTGLNLNSLGAAKDSLNNAAIVTLSNMTGFDGQRVLRQADEVVRISENANLSTVNGLFNTANRLLGTNAFGGIVDMQTESAILGSLMTEAARSGVVSLFDELWDKVDKNDKYYNGSVGYYSVSNSITMVIFNGDLVMLNKLIDKIGGSAIMSQYPEAITEFLSRYKLDYEKGVSDYPAIRKALDDTFVRLDPNWSKIVIAGQTVYRLDPFIRANTVIKAVYELNALGSSNVSTATASVDMVALAATIANSYPKQSGTSLLRSFYPNIPYA